MNWLQRFTQSHVALVLLCSLAMPLPAHAAPTGGETAPVDSVFPPSMAGTFETVVKEPVFHGQAHVYTAGRQDAPTVVLVHGIGDKGARDWERLTAVLAQDFRVISFDLPGFGRSSRGNLPYTPENYVAFVRHLAVEQAWPKPFFLVGHSMGGAIALRYAARHPHDVAALVLVDVPGILHRLAYSRFMIHLGINFLPSLYRAQSDHLSNLAGSILSLVERARPAPEAILATARLRQNFLSGEPSRIAGLALALEDFSADIARVQAPTLVLWGGRDELAPLRNGRVLSANLAQAQLEVFETSGHTPMDDVPEVFTRRVAAFLRTPVLDRRNDILHRELVWPVSTRAASCNRQHGMIFEGDYDRVTINRCRNTQLRTVRVRELRITNATVSIEDSWIGGVNGGLIVDDARVSITSSVIEGRTAITAIASHLDIAGCRIIGSESALVAPRQSEILFSVSRVQSPHFHGSLHELRIVAPGNPL